MVYLVALISYAVALGFFTHSLLLLKDVETLIRILVLVFFYIVGFTYFILGLVCLFSKRYLALMCFSIFMILLVPVFSLGSSFINRIYDELGGLNTNRVTITTNLIVLNGSEIDEASRIGMIADEEDIAGHVLALRLIEAEALSANEIILFDDYFEMIADLAEGKIEGAFFPSNYRAMFGNIESLEEIIENLNVLFDYSMEFDNDALGNDRTLTEPFTVLIVGVDANIPNGNVLMLLTYNPQTLAATMFSIPRDLYVQITCFNNNFQKINSSASRMGCAIDTIEKLMGIPIDFYVKIDFFGFVDLVEALGGVTVDVEAPDFRMNKGHDCGDRLCEQDSKRRWGEHTVWITPGEQRLNGEQALAYARNRYQFRDGDAARNRHQQQLIMAIASEARNLRSISDVVDILNILGQNIDTNMSTNQILSLYNVGMGIIRNMRDDNPVFAVERMVLEVYDLRVFLPRARSHTWALGYFQDSLDEIIQGKKVNLGLAERELIKTIDFSVNNPFEPRPLGRGLRSGDRLELMPSLTGQSAYQAEAWARARGIDVTIQHVNPGDSLYNPNAANGTVVGQSIHQNELVIIQTRLTIQVINRSSNVNNPPPVQSETEPEEQNSEE